LLTGLTNSAFIRDNEEKHPFSLPSRLLPHAGLQVNVRVVKRDAIGIEQVLESAHVLAPQHVVVLHERLDQVEQARCGKLAETNAADNALHELSCGVVRLDALVTGVGFRVD
jgi:hypothetical protein